MTMLNRKAKFVSSTVSKLYDMWKAGNLTTIVGQRHEGVWQRAFFHNFLNRIIITGSFKSIDVYANGDGVWELIDGQQRILSCLVSFIENRFQLDLRKLTIDVTPWTEYDQDSYPFEDYCCCFFDELPDQIKSRILTASTRARVLDKIDFSPKEAREEYTVLNYVSSRNTKDEINKAIFNGDFTDLIERLGRNSFLREADVINDSTDLRMVTDSVVAYIITQAVTLSLVSGKQIRRDFYAKVDHINMGSSSLKRNYRKAFKASIGRIMDCFDAEEIAETCLRERGFFVSLCHTLDLAAEEGFDFDSDWEAVHDGALELANDLNRYDDFIQRPRGAHKDQKKILLSRIKESSTHNLDGIKAKKTRVRALQEYISWKLPRTSSSRKALIFID